MRKAASKALYLFLCAILGMVLFAMLHRAIFVLYDLLLVFDYNTYSLGLSGDGIMALDFVTLLAALFLGGWYGTLLGMDWYSIVYGPNAERPAGMFHGFVPHQWRNSQKAVAKSVPAPKLISKPATSVFTPVTVPVVAKIKEWSFDDLLSKPAPKKRATVKRATTRKTTRKPAAKRVVKTES